MYISTVGDVMTADPVTVTPDTPLKDAADLMVEQKISVLPVVGPHGELVGLVAEADLMKKEELADGGRPVRGTHHRSRWTHAATAGEIMTHPLTVSPRLRSAVAARLMDKHRVPCLVVTGESGKLLGIVTPRDLLRVFIRPDEDIRAEIINDVLERYLGTNPALAHVSVREGVVTLTGEVGQRSMLPFVVPMTRAVDGVIDVEAELTYAVDDSIADSSRSGHH